MGLLGGIADPVTMAQVEARNHIAQRVAEQMGCTVAEAKCQMDYWDQVAMETFCSGNDYPRAELH